MACNTLTALETQLPSFHRSTRWSPAFVTAPQGMNGVRFVVADHICHHTPMASDPATPGGCHLTTYLR